MQRELHILKDGTGEAKVAHFGLEPDWDMPVTLLIHGYNVEPEEATSAYKKLLETIGRAAPLSPLLKSRSWLVYWAGYASWGLAPGKILISPLTYAAQISSACEAAKGLKQYIDRNSGGKVKVNIIAHSLGCRLALEMLEEYAAMPIEIVPDFSVVILMAAAVPTYFFEDLKRLWKGALLPKRVIVMFSERDYVLNSAFRVGQTFAGEGLFPKAVGATGKPAAGFWTRVVPTQNNHSGYFGDSTTSTEIARAFGQVVPVNLPISVSRVTSAINSMRKLPASGLPSRTLLGDRKTR